MSLKETHGGKTHRGEESELWNANSCCKEEEAKNGISPIAFGGNAALLTPWFQMADLQDGHMSAV